MAFNAPVLSINQPERNEFNNMTMARLVARFYGPEKREDVIEWCREFGFLPLIDTVRRGKCPGVVTEQSYSKTW